MTVLDKINFVSGRWLVIDSNLIPLVQTETEQDVNFTFRLGRNDYQDIVVKLVDFESD